MPGGWWWFELTGGVRPAARWPGGESASISCVEVRDVWTSDVLCSLQMITRLP